MNDLGSNRELIAQAARARRVDEAAERIFPFFKDLVRQGKANPVSFDRDQVMLYLEAFRSKRFMAIVEAEGSFSYDLKTQVAHLNSGLNKSWPAIRQFLFSRQVSEAAGILMSTFESMARIMEACNFRYLPEPDADGDVGPTEPG